MRILGLAVASFVASFVLSAVALTKADASAETRMTSAIRQTPQTCPVEGKTVTNLVKAPRYMYAGTVYYFCCDGCKAKFQANPIAYTRPKSKYSACCAGEGSVSKGEKAGGCCGDKKASPATASDGNALASTASAKLICPISGEELDVATAVAFEYNGKTYYTCCNRCKSKFLADPNTYAKKAESLSPLQGKPANK